MREAEILSAKLAGTVLKEDARRLGHALLAVQTEVSMQKKSKSKQDQEMMLWGRSA